MIILLNDVKCSPRAQTQDRTRTKEKKQYRNGQRWGQGATFAGNAAKVAGRGCGVKNRQRGREERGRYPLPRIVSPPPPPLSRITCSIHRI